jgi:hypothetical protein
MGKQGTVQATPIFQTQTPWPQSESALYLPNDSRLSANLVPTFEDTVVSRSQRGGSPTAVISGF